MEKLDSGQLARRVIILLYLSGGATIEIATPNEYRSPEPSLIYVMNGCNHILEIFEDEFDFLLYDQLIEFSCGSGVDENLFYCYETYTITEMAWDRMKTIRERIMKKQKTAH